MNTNPDLVYSLIQELIEDYFNFLGGVLNADDCSSIISIS